MGVVVRCPSMATHIRTSKCRILSFSVVLSDYSGGSWSKKGKYEYCYQFSNSDFMPSEGDLDTRRPTAEELQAFIS